MPVPGGRVEPVGRQRRLPVDNYQPVVYARASGRPDSQL